MDGNGYVPVGSRGSFVIAKAIVRRTVRNGMWIPEWVGWFASLQSAEEVAYNKTCTDMALLAI